MSIYDSLNDMQRQAVYHTEGPLLILAGAGSGKTRVLTHRIAYLIEEQGINPWNILAITFTNKAAGEMRERVDNLVGFGGESVWVSTFHSSCVRILRRYIDRIGFEKNFTIYDTDDQKTVMKEVCKKLQIDTKNIKEKAILGMISKAKDEMISPEHFEKENDGDYGKMKIAAAYKEYQKQLKKNNALDFDDLLVKTVELFAACPDVLENYQERFRYIMVDEYQDTNTVQFQFVSMLASKYQNLCVVGDDDQSIYKFRGANIKNILNFEQFFPSARVIKLEQNYRSTQNILNAANEVIKNNQGRKSKTLWTDNEEGEKIAFRQVDSGYTEAEIIADRIKEGVESGEYQYHDYACLYRTNAQSRELEERFINRNIPYKLIGGVNFYQRKEIKDLLAYLKTIDNGEDDLAVKRIINIPKRGIGATSIQKVQNFADANGISFYQACARAEEIPSLNRAKTKIESFVHAIQVFRTQQQYISIEELMEQILEQTGYVEELKAENTTEAEGRIENIDELISKIAAFEENLEPDGEGTLSEFLEEVALVADIDNLDENSDYVVLMTIHSAKGLEFPNVFLCGMEDGLFPSYMTMQSDDPSDMEEERRLCYVAITRAMEHLMITCARQRMIRGETQYNNMSRFIQEIPRELMDMNMGRQAFANAGRQEASSGSASQHLARPSTMSNARPIFRTKPFSNVSQPKNFEVKTEGALEYGVGDKVRHMKFGVGQVTAIVEGGRDYEVTVQFETAGGKKMFASFAKLKKV